MNRRDLRWTAIKLFLNLRLTLDQDITWRTSALDLRCGVWGERLLEPGQVLMESKIANAMPLWLAEALSECSLQAEKGKKSCERKLTAIKFKGGPSK